MIQPTLGRIVHFTPAKHDPVHGQDLQAAVICHVWGPKCVNLAVFDANGKTYPAGSVMLLQDDDQPPSTGYYAEWPVKV